jgi:hypothetical protein
MSNPRNELHDIIYLSLFIYSYVHTLFGPFLPLALHPLLLPPPPSLPGRTCSVLFSSFVEEKTSAIRKIKHFC